MGEVKELYIRPVGKFFLRVLLENLNRRDYDHSPNCDNTLIADAVFFLSRLCALPFFYSLSLFSEPFGL